LAYSASLGGWGFRNRLVVKAERRNEKGSHSPRQHRDWACSLGFQRSPRHL